MSASTGLFKPHMSIRHPRPTTPSFRELITVPQGSVHSQCPEPSSHPSTWSLSLLSQMGSSWRAGTSLKGSPLCLLLSTMPGKRSHPSTTYPCTVHPPTYLPSIHPPSIQYPSIHPPSIQPLTTHPFTIYPPIINPSIHPPSIHLPTIHPSSIHLSNIHLSIHPLTIHHHLTTHPSPGLEFQS